MQKVTRAGGIVGRVVLTESGQDVVVFGVVEVRSRCVGIRRSK